MNRNLCTSLWAGFAKHDKYASRPSVNCYHIVRGIEGKNPVTLSLCFSDLKNQDETDVKENQLSLQMIVVLCVTSLVAVGMVCGTIVVVIMYKRWAAKHQGIEDRNMASPPAKPRKPQVLKL